MGSGWELVKATRLTKSGGRSEKVYGECQGTNDNAYRVAQI